MQVDFCSTNTRNPPNKHSIEKPVNETQKMQPQPQLHQLGKRRPRNDETAKLYIKKPDPFSALEENKNSRPTLFRAF